MAKTNTVERLLERCVPEPNTGCLLWPGATSHGYGTARFGGRMRYLHRIVAEWAGIDTSDCILHKCDTPACCNPQHLFAGSHADNTRDKVAKGRCANQRRTHCKYGHPIDGLVRPQKQQRAPYRCCLECKRVAVRKWTSKKNGCELGAE